MESLLTGLQWPEWGLAEARNGEQIPSLLCWRQEPYHLRYPHCLWEVCFEHKAGVRIYLAAVVPGKTGEESPGE